jgi:two-component system phosphate regulon sensor histidine kinase PhoR
MNWQPGNHLRVLLALLATFLLGLGASGWLGHGVPALLRAFVLLFCLVVLVLLAGWVVRWLVLPLRSRDRSPVSLEDLPRLLAEMEGENLSLKELREAEDALRRGILARLQEGVILLGPEGTVKLYNPAAESLLGRGAALVKGASSTALFREPEAQRSLAEAWGGVDAEWSVRRGHRTLRVRGIPFRPEQGGGLLLTLDDITRQEALESTRQRFVSNLSHELRTPLTSLRIAAENLQAEQTASGVGDPNLGMLLRGVDRMNLLLEDISELSRIESGALRLAPAPLELEPFVQDLVDAFSPLAREKGIALETRLLAAGKVQPTVDALRLHQLLGNLLANAIKFSPAGTTVTLGLGLSEGRMRWEVRDQGPGIPLNDQPRIFERFFRSAAVRAVPGTGLGLAIVKHLTLLMGGEVSFASEPGRGATFWVELPAGPD